MLLNGLWIPMTHAKVMAKSAVATTKAPTLASLESFIVVCVFAYQRFWWWARGFDGNRFT